MVRAGRFSIDCAMSWPQVRAMRQHRSAADRVLAGARGACLHVSVLGASATCALGPGT
jgi:hypothetical protein